MGEGKRQPDPSSQPRRKAAVFFIDSSEEFVG
jgi:hypothetical protein